MSFQAEASEPSTEGANKFFFTSKGHKHTFKAATAAERDAWVAELKAKIEEAKVLAASVTESETYKKTLEALKPAKKEEKPAEPVAEAAATPTVAVEETPAVATEAAAEAPKEEEAKKDELAVEEPKRRSASRKRASIFGSVFGKKEEKKVEAPAEPEVAATETPAVATEVAAAEIAAAPVEAAAPAEAAETPKAEEEKKEEATESKPPVTKRHSLFSNLSFGKKKVASPEPTPVAETAPAA